MPVESDDLFIKIINLAIRSNLQYDVFSIHDQPCISLSTFETELPIESIKYDSRLPLSLESKPTFKVIDNEGYAKNKKAVKLINSFILSHDAYYNDKESIL